MTTEPTTPEATPIITPEDIQETEFRAYDPHNPTAETPEQAAAMVETLRTFGLSENDAAKLLAGPTSVTPEIRATCEAAKARFMRDPGFVQRYMDGGEWEARMMMELSLRLSVPVKEAAK